MILSAMRMTYDSLEPMIAVSLGRVEYIRSLQFLSNEEHLIVSTNERLILVVIPMTTDYVQQFGNAGSRIHDEIY
jgi:hypothetical protein